MVAALLRSSRSEDHKSRPLYFCWYLLPFKPSTMFREASLEALVPRKIFERGREYYYENDAVGRIRRSGNTFKAKVRGTETYRIELIIRPGKLPKIYYDYLLYPTIFTGI